MTFSRVKVLGWAWGETLASADMNSLDLDHSRAIDGFAGGAYNPTAAIVINNQLEVDSTGAAAANVAGIIATGKGTLQGISATGGATSGVGVSGIGGAPDGEGVTGVGSGIGSGVIGTGGATNGVGVLGLGTAAGPGVLGAGGGTDGTGVRGEGGVTNGIGIVGIGAGTGGGVSGTGGGTSGSGGVFTGGVGNARGVYSTATGNQAGIEARGGPTNGTGAYLVGQGTGRGASGIGGVGGGGGLYGLGKVGAPGVEGTGGATSGTGVDGQGGAVSGIGVLGTGGAPDGTGVKGQGTGAGAGVHGIGGVTDAYGGVFTGGATNGPGIYAAGSGTGAAADLRRATGPHINMQPAAGDPAAPAEGDIWAESGGDEIVAYMDGAKHQLLDTWVHGTTDGAGAVAINDDNNITSIAINATTVTVTIARNFANATYAAVGTVKAAFSAFPVVTGQAVGTFDFQVFDDAGIVQNPQTVAFSFGFIVKGKFA